MAGSVANFVYTTDAGTQYLVRLDESNAVAAGFPVADAAAIALPALPNRVKMRYVNCRSDTGISRKIFCPLVTSPLWTGATRTVDLIVITGLTGAAKPFTISSRIGEKERYITVADTGQTDQPGVGASPAA
jgi:hypothetical protein